MLYCGVKRCHNGTYTNMCRGLSSFGLPKDSAVRRKWLKFAGLDEYTEANRNFRICMEHFEKKCFKTFYPRPLLKLNAIPTISNQKKKREKEKSPVQNSEKHATLEMLRTTLKDNEISGEQNLLERTGSDSEERTIPEVSTKAIEIGEKNVTQVELVCNKVRNITISGKNFKTFTLYNLGDCSLTMQFER